MIPDNGKFFKVKSRDGRIWDIPESKLDASIARGGEVVDEAVETSQLQSPQREETFQIKKVQSPDGRIWDIPESNVQAALDRGGKLVEDNSVTDSWSKYGARKAKDLVSGAAGGLVDTITAPYNIPAALTNAASEMSKDNPLEIDSVSGMPIQKSESRQPQLPLIPSATEAIDKGIDSLTNDYTKTPEDEKTSQAALRTIGAVLSPGGLAKGAASLGLKGASKALGAIGSTNPTSLASAGAAGAVMQEASDRGYGVAASIGAGLGAGAATGTALGAAKAFNVKLALAKLTGNSPKNINLEALEAAEKAGLDYPNTLVNEGKGLALVEQVVGKSPVFGTKYNKKLSKIDKEYAGKVDEAISNVGQRIVESGDSLDTGSQIKETFENIRQSIINEKNERYMQAASALPENASILPKNLAKTIQGIRNTIKTLRPSTDESFVLKYLDDLESGLFLGSGTDKMAVPVPIDMLSGTKVSINDIINWDVNASGAKQQLKRVQNALKEDLKEYGNKNPEWYKAFSEADQFYGDYLGDKSLSSDTVKKILSQENPEKIISNLKDISDFENIKQALGRDEAGKKFFDSIKREKLTDLIMGKVIDNKTGNVTYAPFSKAIENPQTKQLVKYLAGESYQDIFNLKKYAEAALRRNQRNPNPSGTGPTNAIIGGFIGAAAESGGVIKQAKSFAKLAAAGAGLSWLVSNKMALKWGIEAAKKQASGNYKDANILGKRIERSMVQDLGEDFVRQFVALSDQESMQ